MGSDTVYEIESSQVPVVVVVVGGGGGCDDGVTVWGKAGETS